MKKNIFLNNLKAFTLIELLIVITIIGILATGGISIFTTQLQGARDTTRISDIKLQESSLAQIYSDESQYPTTTAYTGAIKEFISKNLIDPKNGINVCWADATNHNQTCQGYYNVGDDAFGSPQNAFKLSVHFEKKANFDRKAINSSDGGSVQNAFEIFAGSSGATLPLTGAIVY